MLLAVLEATFWILPVREATPRLAPTGDDRITRFRPNERRRYSAGWNFFLVNEMRTNSAGWVSDIEYAQHAETPLVAVVGDSFVQGEHLPWSETCHGRLARHLDGEIRVYSFGMNMAPLSQYLGYAEHARDTYRPAAMVIPIIENDFDQSLRWIMTPSRHSLFYTLDEAPDGGLVLVPPGMPVERTPLQRLRRWLNRNSRLMRYRTYHVGETFRRIKDERLRNDRNVNGTPDAPFNVTDPADLHPDRVAESRRAVDAFLRMLPKQAGLPPEQVVFVVDGIRPYRYTEGWEHRWDGSYHDVMRRYFMDEALQKGYEVIDMQPVFVDHYRSRGDAFNWRRDNHWNALAHGLCADQVARSRMLQRLRKSY